MKRSFGPAATIVVALVVALVFLVLAVAPPSLNDDPSSRAAGRSGTLALHDWLAGLGLPTHRISGDFSTSGSDVVFLVDPTVAVGTADSATLMDFLAGGGDLVLAISAGHAALAEPLLSRLHIALAGRSIGVSVPAQPIDAGDRVHRVPMGAGPEILSAPQLTPLLAQAGRITAVAEATPGGGRAYVLTSPFPLTNDGLRQEDSSTFVLSLLTRARGGAIGFDEYHHGEQHAAADGAAAIFNGPLGLALGLAVLSVVTFLAMSGRRLGRRVPATDAALVPSTASYIDAVAGLFGRSGDRGVVAERYADELKQRIGTRAGLDPRAGDDEFVSGVEASRAQAGPPVREALSEARRLAAGSPSAAALLQLARNVDELERRWTEPEGVETNAQ